MEKVCEYFVSKVFLL